MFLQLSYILGNKVGMRMGFGVKDESEETIIHFVTTGYIVRLLAHHPESFSEHTHLIIDEVHERSVDGDLLCLLARRLLEYNPNIHLVLMSATIHTQLYKNYFSQENTSNKEYYGDLECLSVGVRRFPIEIKYMDDLALPNTGECYIILYYYLIYICIFICYIQAYYYSTRTYMFISNFITTYVSVYVYILILNIIPLCL